MRRTPRRQPHLDIPSPEADALVAQAIGGDTDAFAELFRATAHLVHGNIYGRCGDPSLAEDLTSDTYIRAMKAVRRFEGGSRDFLAWLMRIARNLFFDHMKSGRVKWESVVDEMPNRPAGHDPARDALARVEAEHLRRALGRLTDEQQEVVYLRFLEDLPITDVANIVGRTEGAVKALQFRALKQLARILEEDETSGGLSSL